MVRFFAVNKKSLTAFTIGTGANDTTNTITGTTMNTARVSLRKYLSRYLAAVFKKV
jgi:hypothetical protein